MATLKILCAGAAQAVTEKIVVQLSDQGEHTFEVHYDAVNALKAKLLDGAPADAVVLSAPLMTALIASKHVVAESCAELGKVDTGLAVKAHAPMPAIETAEHLRANLLAATRIYCPDPARATAGKIVMTMLDKLGIAEALRARIEWHPNGFAALRALADTDDGLAVTMTQVTEILAAPGVALVGALPADLAEATTYVAGVTANAASPEPAREFVRRLTGFVAKPLLSAAGYRIAG